LKRRPIEELPEGVLAVHGTPSFARVVEFGARSSRSRSRKWVYQYFPAGQPPVTVTRWVESISEAPSRRPGDALLVIYDPRQPEVHIVYETLPFTVELSGTRG
jgi:hypothetical protein